MHAERPRTNDTVRVMTIGTLVCVAFFTAAFFVRLANEAALADTIATVAVIVLLATPVAALVTTTFELRGSQRSSSGLALLVLLILAAATALALLTSR
jgi:cytochrome bd-type quinol oxidase subunit 2